MYPLDQLKKYGKDVYISPTVDIKRPQLVIVGSHVAIDSYLYLTTAASIGNHVHISAHVGVIGGKEGKLVMGNFTNISLGGRIICGSDAFLGEGFITAPGIPDKFRDQLKIAPVIFEDYVNTGANVTVLPGVTLAKGSVIGANSLVTQSTEPWTIYAGSPARPIKMRKKEIILEYAKQMGYEQ